LVPSTPTTVNGMFVPIKFHYHTPNKNPFQGIDTIDILRYRIISVTLVSLLCIAAHLDP
jgi:hypothetical protein